MYKIDLNSDLGESFGSYKIGGEEEIFPYITSANVACGFHASDPCVMDQTIASAKTAGIQVGAHPGFPDLMGFGRRNMSVTPKEAYDYVLYQIGALDGFLRAHGMKMQHVKPHGALYNMAGKDEALAEGICKAVKDFDDNLIVLALAGSKLASKAEEMNLRVAAEYFADRAYEADGSLRNRRLEGSMITDEDEALNRTIRMIKENKVKTYDGSDITLNAQSICVHGDGEKAVLFVQRIRAKLAEEGVEIKPLGDIV